MIIGIDTGKKKDITTIHNVCEYHQKHHGKPFAGCTCSSSYSIGDAERNYFWRMFCESYDKKKSTKGRVSK